MRSHDLERHCGDNIYEPLGDGQCRQQPSAHSGKHVEHDLGGKYVLVARDFVYFGANAIPLPPEFSEMIVGRAHKCNFPPDPVHAFVQYVSGFGLGVHARPIRWPPAWTRGAGCARRDCSTQAEEKRVAPCNRWTRGGRHRLECRVPYFAGEVMMAAATTPKYVKLERISLKDDAQLNERWVQDRIAEDPSILGLGGELIVKDKERMQPHAGRLDLLLMDSESSRRYEVEVQLGRTDESHIIRTIEYWDIERKRYPQYDHCAVIVAEDISSRFLNVISLFNGSIPLIAIQMQALRVGDQVTLVFSTVVDELALGLEEDDEEEAVAVDRSYWEDHGSKLTVGMTDQLFSVLRQIDDALELKYNKYYIGLARGGHPYNFVTFKPRKTTLNVAFTLRQSDEIERKIESSGFDTLEYDKRGGRYRLRFTADDLKAQAEAITELMRLSYESWGR